MCQSNLRNATQWREPVNRSSPQLAVPPVLVPRVVVELRDGMTYVYVDSEVSVVTLDYDVDGVQDEEITLDSEGERCVIRREAEQNPELVDRAFHL